MTMAFLPLALDENYGGDFRELRAFFESLDEHAAGVRNFLRGEDEDLFANQFGNDEALGLIGDLVFGEILWALGQRVDDGGEQLFLAELFFG